MGRSPDYKTPSMGAQRVKVPCPVNKDPPEYETKADDSDSDPEKSRNIYQACRWQQNPQREHGMRKVGFLFVARLSSDLPTRLAIRLAIRLAARFLRWIGA